MTEDARDRAYRYLEEYCEHRPCRECPFMDKENEEGCTCPDLDARAATDQQLEEAIRKIPWKDLLMMRTKEDATRQETADQTAKADAGKLQLTLVPRQIIRDIAAVRMFGTEKY